MSFVQAALVIFIAVMKHHGQDNLKRKRLTELMVPELYDVRVMACPQVAEAAAEITHLGLQVEDRMLGIAGKFFEISKPISSNTTPLTTPEAPKQFHQLETKYSSI